MMYNRHEIYPKRLNIKFDLALCINNKKLRRKCKALLAVLGQEWIAENQAVQ